MTVPAARAPRGSSFEQFKAIQDVAAGLAHELRNPVFSIAAAAQLLRYRAGDDPVIETNVGRILREVERLNTLVSALLEFGRPAPSHLAPANPDDVWTRALEAHRGALESKALLVRRSIALRHAVCDVDAEQLAQAFSHFLGNAIDAAPSGSDLALESRLSPEGSWESSLRNSGTPVSEEFLPRAFDLLTTTKPGHAGIGLAIAQRIVAEYGGSVRLASTAAHGTTVSITLPALD